jgi:hypothetical protein
MKKKQTTEPTVSSSSSTFTTVIQPRGDATPPSRKSPRPEGRPSPEEETYGPDDPAEAAFTQSDSHALGDLDLQPYTPDRAWAAQAMGLRYGFVDDAGVEFFKEHRIYPGALRDVAIVLWLCSITDEVEIDKASRNPIAAARKAATWSHEHKLGNVRHPEFWSAYAVFMKIMAEVDASVSVPDTTGNESGPSPNA